MKKISMLSILIFIAAVLQSRGSEIGFAEEFALSPDREVPLSKLIPGTEDHFFYRCLHDQNNGRLEEVDSSLEEWIRRHGRTARVIEIENRQALLRYATDPTQSLSYLKRTLGLSFNDRPDSVARQSNLPSRLDPQLIDRENLKDRALRSHRGTLAGFQDPALHWLLEENLSKKRRRKLLARLRWPDHADLPRKIVEELNPKEGRAFGSLEIHSLLLRGQLEACLRLKPELLNDPRFVEIFLTKLAPSDDSNWRQDRQARSDYLQRLEDFSQKLSESFNSHKANFLYHRLVHDRSLGVYDRDRFLRYLRLPRNVGYIRKDYMAQQNRRRYRANLNANFVSSAGLEPIRADEPLVRSYLEHFFANGDSISDFDQWIENDYLKWLFAEVKILNGQGDLDKWFSWLPPHRAQALKDRIELEFIPSNRVVWPTEEDVVLEIAVKNVPTLIVKVYEINTPNYYRTNDREIGSDINLDGLVPNKEFTFNYDSASWLRVRRSFDFPSLPDRGVFVIEFIGNGKSSRALVRKGDLRFIERRSAAGHVITVMNEDNEVLAGASIRLGRQYFAADKAGKITLPYAAEAAHRSIVIQHGDFAVRKKIVHVAENYLFHAGFFVDAQSLLPGAMATVLVRPRLSIHGTPLTLSVLENPKLTIQSRDLDGVGTTEEIANFPIYEDRESSHTFRVPDRLAEVSFSLQAEVENLSRAKRETVSAEGRATATSSYENRIENLYLIQTDEGYAIDFLGRSGEPKPRRTLHLTLHHRDFTDAVRATFATDANGRVSLGPLDGITSIVANTTDGGSYHWIPAEDQNDLPSVLHASSSETIRIPYFGKASRPRRSELSLLERRGNTFLADRFDALRIRNGYLEIRDLPPGDYELLLKEKNTRVAIKLTKGEAIESHLFSPTRRLEVPLLKPLHIVAFDTRRGKVEIQLGNSGQHTRVHLFETRFESSTNPYTAIASRNPDFSVHLDSETWKLPESTCLSGRKIGDEYRYILERRFAKKFPGNLLERPRLLLNPWALRETQTAVQAAKEGEEWAEDNLMARLSADHGIWATTSTSSYMRYSRSDPSPDFLAQPPVSLLNLRPDESGKIVIDRSDLRGMQQLHIVAVDPVQTVYRRFSLGEEKLDPLDLRLADGLDPDQTLSEQNQITPVLAGEKFEIENVQTAAFEIYDRIEKVFRLYSALNPDPTLAEFRFLIDWPDLGDEEKRAKYSEYACHEVNFFLFHKDPDFFESVVLPYVRNKKDATFLDEWLTGQDLTRYAEPWAFSQLNTVERILLGRRLESERNPVARYVQDALDLLPPDANRRDHLFKTALNLGQLQAAPASLAIDSELQTRKGAFSPFQAGVGGLGSELRRGELSMRKRALSKSEAKSLDKLRALGNLAEGHASSDMAFEMEASDEISFFDRDEKRRSGARQLYRKLEKTKEWVENNYYHVRIEEQNAGLVPVNQLWRDYAKHDPGQPFLSPNFAEASSNLHEILLALAVLDFPFEPEEHEPKLDANRFSIRAGSPAVVFHKEVGETEPPVGEAPILVNQGFFRSDDRFGFRGNEWYDKYVTGEFLTGVAYGAVVTCTNPTSAPRRFDLLLEIPRGAIPVSRGQYTRTIPFFLAAYETKTIEYAFYFPAEGEFVHYPAQASKEGRVIARAEPFRFRVVDELTDIDINSWDYISQQGTADQVVEYLSENNLNRIDLGRIAWRMKDEAFFNRSVALLAARHHFAPRLWSYSIEHDAPQRIREYLEHQSGFVSQCGAAIDSPLLAIDPVIRKTYQHMEYEPLVNARAHPLGSKRTILNDRFAAQYARFMNALGYQPSLDDESRLAVAYYFLLQDRIEEALEIHAAIDPEQLASRLQYDYMGTHLAFYSEDYESARRIAGRYADYPVDRWRERFEQALAQLDEAEGGSESVTDPESLAQLQARLASTEPSLDLSVEAKRIRIEYQNLGACQLNYYLMDIELLFSRTPFSDDYSDHFSAIRPNFTERRDLPADRMAYEFDLPERFRNSNVLVEVIAGGIQEAQVYFANTLSVQIVENYGQIRVRDSSTGKPLPKVYAKAYARMKNGDVRFFRDGYTDLRGALDYASLSTDELDRVEKFSILILSEKNGATVREADPPQR